MDSTKNMKKDITGLVNALLALRRQTGRTIVHDKIDAALTKIKTARTLMEQAESTMHWAEGYISQDGLRKHGSN